MIEKTQHNNNSLNKFKVNNTNAIHTSNTKEPEQQVLKKTFSFVKKVY